MRTDLRVIVGTVVLGHGAIHLLGAAKGLGWAEVTALHQPIGTTAGAAWLTAAALVVVSGVMIIRAVRGWWMAAAAAAVVSQAVISTSWSDARAGTVVNVVLLLAAGYGYASQGPRSLQAEYRRRSAAALAGPVPAGVVTEADLARLPGPVAAYVRRSGAVGQRRVVSFRARIHGRIRGGPTKRWMPFTGEQVNTYGPAPRRLFSIRATMLGLPVDVLHVLVGRSATMRVKLCSVLPMVDAAGPVMDRTETVTLFNDLCVLAPAALVDAPVTWGVDDDHHVRGVFTNGVNTVSAVLVFDDSHDLVDFVSDDRQAASVDGRVFIPQRWSTPLLAYATIGRRRVAVHGEGHWHPPEPGGEYCYLEFHVDDITYDAGSRRPGHRTRTATPSTASPARSASARSAWSNR